MLRQQQDVDVSPRKCWAGGVAVVALPNTGRYGPPRQVLRTFYFVGMNAGCSIASDENLYNQRRGDTPVRSYWPLSITARESTSTLPSEFRRMAGHNIDRSSVWRIPHPPT